MRKITTQINHKLFLLFFIGLLLFNYPFLSLFSNRNELFNIPVLFVYLFAVWTFLIILYARFIEGWQKKNTGDA